MSTNAGCVRWPGAVFTGLILSHHGSPLTVSFLTLCRLSYILCSFFTWSGWDHWTTHVCHAFYHQRSLPSFSLPFHNTSYFLFRLDSSFKFTINRCLFSATLITTSRHGPTLTVTPCLPSFPFLLSSLSYIAPSHLPSLPLQTSTLLPPLRRFSLFLLDVYEENANKFLGLLSVRSSLCL